MLFKTYPTLFITLLFTAGTFLNIQLPTPLLLMGILTCLLVAMLCLFLGTKKLISLYPLFSTFFLVLGLGLLGVLRINQLNEISSSHVIHTLSTSKPEERVIKSVVVDFPQRTSYGWKFTANIQEVLYESGWKSFNGLVQVTLISHHAFYLQKGDIVQLNGLLAKPLGKRNPMDFNYQQFLQQKGIFVQFKSKQVHLIAHSSNFFVQTGNYTRTFIREALHKGFQTPEYQALMFALLVGDRSEIGEVTTEQFRKTGLMHLLAVSGLHIFLLGMIVFELLRSFLNRTKLSFIKREYARSIITILLLILFWMVTGNSPSILRAILMATVAILANLWQRPNLGLNALGFSAFILLLWNPYFLYEVGFQLSYSAVLALMFLYPPLEKLFTVKKFPNKAFRSILLSIMVSIAATLGTLPVMMYHFGTVSLSGIILNVVGVPLSSVALINGLLSVIAFSFSEALGMILGASAEFFVHGFSAFTVWGYDNFSWMQLSFFLRSFTLFCSVLTVLWLIADKMHRKWAVFTLLFFITIHFYGFIFTPQQQNLKVTFFDVGHGDAALIEFPNGKTMLVDVGDCTPYADMGKQVIVPHFLKQNKNHVDVVLITHPHGDHIGGLPAVLRNLKVGQILMNGDLHDNPFLRTSLQIADSLKVPVLAVKEDDKLNIDPSVVIHILSTFGHHFHDNNPNNGSIVFNLQYGATKFLFTGDAEAEAESNLIHKYPEALGANVIKVGHHGSKTSSTTEFVQKATAYAQNEYAVVSVSAEGKHGLPDYSALIRWKEAGAKVLSTAHQQAILFSSNGKTIKAIDWKNNGSWDL